MRPEQREFDLRDYAVILLRRKWWVIVSFIAVVTGGAIYTLMQTPVYQAGSKIRIRSTKNVAIPGAEAGFYLEEEDIPTQLQIIRGEVSRQAQKKVESTIGRIHIHNLQIDQVRETNVVSILVNAEEPVLAAALADTIAEQYLTHNLADNRRGIKQQLDFVRDQVAIARRELDQAERELRNFKERAALIEANATAGAQAAKVSSLQGRIDDLAVEQRAVDAELARVNQQLGATAPTIVAETQKESNPAVDALKARILALELDRLQLLNQYTEGSRRIRAMDDQIHALEDKLVAEVQRVVTVEKEAANPLVQQLVAQQSQLEGKSVSTQARAGLLSSLLPREVSKLRTMPAAQVTYQQLSRRAKVAEDGYVRLLARQQDLLLAQESVVANVDIIERAANPYRVSPNGNQNLMLAALVGALLGVLLAMLVDFVDDSVKDPHEAENLTGLPILGVIYASGPELPLGIDASPQTAEALRTARTNMRFTAATPLKSVVITSPGAREGKSSIAAGLAITAAGAGQNVVLVDTDLRQPSLHEVFEKPNEVGLTNLLIGERDLGEVLQATEVPGLQLLPAGPIPPNPVELLESPALHALLERLRLGSDLVVMDSPPATFVVDSQILSSMVDGVVLVFENKRTRRDDLRASLTAIKRAGGSVLGLIANRVRGGTAHGQYYYTESAHHSSLRTGTN